MLPIFITVYCFIVCFITFLTQTEDAIKKQGFEKATIFQPGLLERGTKKRFVEKAFGE